MNGKSAPASRAAIETLLAARGIEAAILELTANGYAKSYMDATAPVRAFLRTTGLHDYARQRQGQPNKVLLNALLVGTHVENPIQISLYRPTTKDGDPRIWPLGLKGTLRPGDVLALFAMEGRLHVVVCNRPGAISSIERLLGPHAAPVAGPEDEILSELSDGAATGQGSGLSPADRRCVELYAMAAAIEHYRRTWPQVNDVSATQSYDVECRRGNEVLRVEVKGTTGRGESILLTAGEVRSAREHHPETGLFVVSSIALVDGDRARVASGGECMWWEPWYPEEQVLEPVSFRYSVPSQGRAGGHALPPSPSLIVETGTGHAI